MDVLNILAKVYKSNNSEDKKLLNKADNIMEFLDGRQKSDAILPTDLQLDIKAGKENINCHINMITIFLFFLFA